MTSSTRPVVLVLVGFYPPAYIAGGPTKSVPRIVEQLADEFVFAVVTSDRDLGAAKPLAGIAADRWTPIPGGRCLYLGSRRRLLGGLRAIRSARADALYLNSVFSLEFSLIPLALRKLGLIPRRGLVIAPRGELDRSALSIKRRRKRLVLWLVRTWRLLSDATWHTATVMEAEAVAREFGPGTKVLIARDLPLRSGLPTDRPPKTAGTLDVVFLGRIARMKNLDLAISTMQSVQGKVTFSIYGPIEDPAYWAECQRLAAKLPPTVTVQYRGVLEPADVTTALGGYHLFFQPSRAESYGHAINEALMAGCPVLISDQTPWRGLEERHAGWDIPLSRPELFAQIIDQCVAMTQEELQVWSAGARKLADAIAADPHLDAAYRVLFRTATQRRAVRGTEPRSERDMPG